MITQDEMIDTLNLITGELFFIKRFNDCRSTQQGVVTGLPSNINNAKNSITLTNSMLAENDMNNPSEKSTLFYNF